MKKKFLKSSIDIIKKSNPNISEEQIEIIEYGLEGIYLTFSKLIILIILSSILGILLCHGKRAARQPACRCAYAGCRGY